MICWNVIGSYYSLTIQKRLLSTKQICWKADFSDFGAYGFFLLPPPPAHCVMRLHLLKLH